MTGTGLRGLALGDDRFFCRDGLLEVWLAILVDRISEEPMAAWQRGLAAEWRSQATVRFDGVMMAELDRHVDRAERAEALARICLELRGAIVDGRLEPGPLARRVMGLGGAELRLDERRDGLVRVADSMLWLLGRQPTGDRRPPTRRARGSRPEVAENTKLWWDGEVR